MTGNEHKILTMFLKLNPLFYLGYKNEDVYEFVLNFYERIHKLGIIHQHEIEFLTF